MEKETTAPQRKPTAPVSRAGTHLPLVNEMASVVIGKVLVSPDVPEKEREKWEEMLASFEKFEVVRPQNTANTVHIVVPEFGDFDKEFSRLMEMRDEDLRNIAGGEIWIGGTLVGLIGTIGTSVGIGTAITASSICVGGASLSALMAGIGIISAMVALPVVAGVLVSGTIAGIGVGIAAGVGAFGHDSDVNIGLAS